MGDQLLVTWEKAEGLLASGFQKFQEIGPFLVGIWKGGRGSSRFDLGTQGFVEKMDYIVFVALIEGFKNAIGDLGSKLPPHFQLSTTVFIFFLPGHLYTTTSRKNLAVSKWVSNSTK